MSTSEPLPASTAWRDLPDWSKLWRALWLLTAGLAAECLLHAFQLIWYTRLRARLTGASTQDIEELLALTNRIQDIVSALVVVVGIAVCLGFTRPCAW